MIGAPAAASAARQLQRRLAAVLHDDALGLLLVDDLQDVLERQRLEVQPVGGVVVGRDGLGVAVDHDGLEAILAQRHRGMHAAVVELDALADAVRSAAQDHDLAPRRRARLALLLVGRVQVGGGGRELGRRRCRRACTPGAAPSLRRRVAHRRLVAADQLRDARIRKALALQRAQARGVEAARSPARAARASSRTRSSICARNHGSMR